MYYIRLDDEMTIISSIIVENVMKKQTSRKKICAYQRFNLDEEQRFSHIINEYAKLDPTLPRINSIRYYSECESNKDEKKRGYVIRYDDVNVKYIYLCAVCNTS